MYQIDQSGKIENTAKDTIICLANGTWDAVKISAKVKRKVQEIFRRRGEPRKFVLLTFCAGLALLLKRNQKVGRVVIDKEYFGKEPVIRKLLDKMLVGLSDPVIEFGLVGKHSSAHLLGREVALGRKKIKCEISVEDILSEIKRTEVERRQKNA